MKHYPDAQQLLASKNGNKELFDAKRSLLSILSIIFLCLSTTVAIFLLDLIAHYFHFNILNYFSIKWLYIIPSVIGLEILRRQYDQLYVFTRDTITEHKGRLSMSMVVPSIRFEDIRSISVEQDIVGRIFQYGNIKIDTASTSTDELEITGIRYPRELALLIEDLQIESLKRRKHIPETNPYLEEFSQKHGLA